VRNGRAVAPRPPQGKRFEGNNEMKKKLMMMVAALVAAFGAWAATETVGGYIWGASVFFTLPV